jgi:hypothetical protein
VWLFICRVAQTAAALRFLQFRAGDNRTGLPIGSNLSDAINNPREVFLELIRGIPGTDSKYC